MIFTQLKNFIIFYRFPLYINSFVYKFSHSAISYQFKHNCFYPEYFQCVLIYVLHEKEKMILNFVLFLYLEKELNYFVQNGVVKNCFESNLYGTLFVICKTILITGLEL